jgi:hypothetical protein
MNNSDAAATVRLAVGWRSQIGTTCLVLLLAGVLAPPLVRIVRGGERIALVPNLEVDARSYDTIALDLSRRRTLDALPSTFPPGFVTVLAAVYATVGHWIVAAKTVLWVCLVLATILAGWIARGVHGTITAGWTAAFLTASSPALQAYTGTLQYEVLVAALILVLIVLALRVAKADSSVAILRRALLVGVALGLAVVTREPLIALIPVFALFVTHQATRKARLAVGAAAGFTILVSSVSFAGAWSVYQSQQAGHAMLIRDNVPAILLRGHSPTANGTYNEAQAGIGEPAGVAFIVAEPRGELRLAWRKLLYFWGVLRDGWNVPRPAAVWLARASGGLVPLDIILPAARGGWLLLALIVACATLRRNQWQELWLLPAIIAALMAVHLATISSHRFAVPILPVVCVLIAGAIAHLITRLKPPGVAAVVMVAIGVSAMQARQWPVTYRLQPTEMDGIAGENRREPDGRLVRFSDAARGRRVALALYDEYLPSGPLVLRVLARRGPGVLPAQSPVARIRLFSLEGGTPCVMLLTIDQMASPDRWTQITLACTLHSDGPARLIVETLGRVDLTFSDVTLQWRRG